MKSAALTPTNAIPHKVHTPLREHKSSSPKSPPPMPPADARNDFIDCRSANNHPNARMCARPLMAGGLALQAIAIGWLAAVTTPTVAYSAPLRSTESRIGIAKTSACRSTKLNCGAPSYSSTWTARRPPSLK